MHQYALLHDSFASALIIGGARMESPDIVAHAGPAITLRIYSYWFKTREIGAVDKLAP